LDSDPEVPEKGEMLTFAIGFVAGTAVMLSTLFVAHTIARE